jgi:hypothetical protein
MQYKDLMPYLKAEEEHTRINTSNMIVSKVSHEPDLQPYLDDLSVALTDKNEIVRFNISYALVVAAEKGIDLEDLAPQFTILLDDSVSKIQKEALWALVCISSNGKSIKPAVKKLEEITSNPNNLTGNGTIALAAHYLFNDEASKALALLDAEHGQTRFGVAYAATMHCIGSKEKKNYKQVLGRIKAGLSDRDLITGVAGALLWAEENLGTDHSYATQTINEVIKESETEIQRAALGGIFVNMQMQKRK